MEGDDPPPPIHAVEFVPAPGFPEDLARELAQQLSRRVNIPCRVSALRFDAPPPRLPTRNQVDADAFLRRTEALPREPGHVLVGLTVDDIGHPIFTFFFGRARHGGSTAVISLARLVPEFYGLPPDREITSRRAVQEILHELGHVAGLGHCEDHDCVMRFVANVEALDTRGRGFCPSCTDRVGALRT